MHPPPSLSVHPPIHLSVHPSLHPSLLPHCHVEHEGLLTHFYMRRRGYGQCRREVSRSQRKHKRKKEHWQKWRLEGRGVVAKMTQTGWTGQSAMARGNDRKSANRIERVFLSPAVPNLAWLSLSVAIGGGGECFKMVSVNAECLCHFWGWLFIKQTQTVRNQRGEMAGSDRAADITLTDDALRCSDATWQLKCAADDEVGQQVLYTLHYAAVQSGNFGFHADLPNTTRTSVSFTYSDAWKTTS